MRIDAFTIATSPTAGLSRLTGSLAKVGFPVTLLGENEPTFRGYGWKWKTFVHAARRSVADTVMYFDGYDSVCMGPEAELPDKITELRHPIVFGNAPHVQPEWWLSLDAGLVVANREALVTVFHEKLLEEMFQDHVNDQEQLQSLFCWDRSVFALDLMGLVFHTICPRSPELVPRNNRLVNPETGRAPTFVHAPRNGDLSKVEQWLAASN